MHAATGAKQQIPILRQRAHGSLGSGGRKESEEKKGGEGVKGCEEWGGGFWGQKNETAKSNGALKACCPSAGLRWKGDKEVWLGHITTQKKQLKTLSSKGGVPVKTRDLATRGSRLGSMNGNKVIPLTTAKSTGKLLEGNVTGATGGRMKMYLP